MSIPCSQNIPNYYNFKHIIINLALNISKPLIKLFNNCQKDRQKISMKNNLNKKSLIHICNLKKIIKYKKSILS
jgi:hypothetical protein